MDKFTKIALNKQRFLDVVASKGGKLLSNYVSYSVKVELECSNGHKWIMSPNHIVNGGSWCTLCPKKKVIKAKENLINIITEKGGMLITDYINARTHVIIQCGIGHQWKATPDSITGTRKTWCPACSNNCPKQSADRFYNKIKEQGGICLSDYKGAFTKVHIRCKNNHERYSTPHTIMSQNYGCAKCANNCPEQSYEKLLLTVEKNEGNILGNYINSFTKISFQCKFGHIWETYPGTVNNHGTWCPVCKESHGERIVRHILDKHHITYIAQKQHPQLPGRRYDFYFIHNGKEYYLEFDGEQHFSYNEFFHKSEQDFEYKRNVDILKSHTVVTNNNYLIRLDYSLTEEEIETHIFKAFESPDKLYVSDPDMYDWILDGVDPKPINLELVINVPNPIIIPKISLTLKIIRKDESDEIPNTSQ